MNTLELLNLARRHGVTPSTLHPLLALMSDPPMGPTEIAGICGVSSSAVTSLVDNLVRLGMVKRVGGPSVDRRTKKIVPTKKAFELFGKVLPYIEATAGAAAAPRDSG